MKFTNPANNSMEVERVPICQKRPNFLLMARCLLFLTFCSLFVARCSFLFAYCSLIFDRYFLLVTCYFILTARYFFLVACNCLVFIPSFLIISINLSLQLCPLCYHKFQCCIVINVVMMMRNIFLFINCTLLIKICSFTKIICSFQYFINF